MSGKHREIVLPRPRADLWCRGLRRTGYDHLDAERIENLDSINGNGSEELSTKGEAA